MRTLYGIGTGPGPTDLLTLRAAKAIDSCDVIFAPKNRGKTMALDTIRPLLNDQKVVFLDFPMGNVTDKDYDRAMAIIDKTIKEGETGGLLTIGDPTIYSTIMNLVEERIPKDMNFQLIPGIPSFVAASNRLAQSMVQTGEAFLLCDQLPEPIPSQVDSIAILKASKNNEHAVGVLEKEGFSTSYIQRVGFEDEEILFDPEEIKRKKNYMALLIGRREKKL